MEEKVIRSNQRFDVIVIGSGIGGLTTAALLARFRGDRVLVLERHKKIGGLTHTFSRKMQYRWDVGLHYVGDMERGSLPRLLFDAITGGNLQWQKMEDPVERFLYPDLQLEVPSDPDAYRDLLIRHFPGEQLAIRRYFRDLKRASKGYILPLMAELFPPPFRGLLRWLAPRLFPAAFKTTDRYLHRKIRDPRLRAVLVSRWGDYGLSPSASAFGIHSMIDGHYAKGGWYPVGSSSSLARFIVPVIEKAGGEVRTGHEAIRILMNGNRAAGVRVRIGEDLVDFEAETIFSDAGISKTYLSLLPSGIPAPCPHLARTPQRADSVVVLFMGLRGSPAQLGFRGENLWIYGSYDHEENLRLTLRFEEEGTDFPFACFVSFASLRDPEATVHTAEAILMARYETFHRWKDQPCKRRDPDYYEFKDRIARGILDFLENRYPGFRDLVDYFELSTPLTVEHYTGAEGGRIYGFPATPERVLHRCSGFRTPVRGLYLTGADAIAPGIVGALMGGAMAASLKMGGFGFFRLISALKSEATRTADSDSGSGSAPSTEGPSGSSRGG